MTDAPAIFRREIRELHLRIALPSIQQEVTNVIAQICQWLDRHGVGAEVRQDVELVLAEALNNVVEHAYLYREDGEIEITVTLTPSSMTTVITDSGCRFDGPPPLRILAVDGMALDELPEGGFGWNLIRTLTDDVQFSHDDGKNHLTLHRRLEPQLLLT